MDKKSFISLYPGGDPLNKILRKLTNYFCKLDYFSLLCKILHNYEMVYLKKRVRKVTHKTYRISVLYCKRITIIIYDCKGTLQFTTCLTMVIYTSSKGKG